MMEQRSGAMPEGLPAGAAGTGDGSVPDAVKLQILATEHWSLLATRSLTWSESFSRTAMFLSTLTGAVVAMALGAQAMPGEGFTVLTLLLLPVVLFLGIATYARLVAINNEDALWVVGMNRLRHAYMELAPDLEKYFISGVYDDVEGVLETFAATRGSGAGVFIHGFVTTPGMICIVDGVLAGVLAGVVSGVLGLGLTVSIAVGAAAFVLAVVVLQAYQYRAYLSSSRRLQPRFPRHTE